MKNKFDSCAHLTMNSSAMIEFLIFRHAEKELDRSKGDGLTAKGRLQAVELGTRLTKLNVKGDEIVFYSSSYKRAIETCSHVGQAYLGDGEPQIRTLPQLGDTEGALFSLAKENSLFIVEEIFLRPHPTCVAICTHFDMIPMLLVSLQERVGLDWSLAKQTKNFYFEQAQCVGLSFALKSLCVVFEFQPRGSWS